jgi:hypothetical protein
MDLLLKGGKRNQKFAKKLFENGNSQFDLIKETN